MLDLEDIRAFVEVAEAGGFGRAGQKLGMSKSIVSRRVARLEAELGAQLLSRTTRGVSVTEAGTAFKERAERALGELEGARDDLAQQGEEIVGRLRISAPLSFGITHLSAVLAELAVRHPKLALDVAYSDRFVDLIGERYDLAIRLGELTDSRLVARRLATRRRMVCASPAYLDRHGWPRRPQDLSAHACLLYTGLRRPAVWELRNARGVQQRVAVSGPLQSDEAELVVAAAQAGLGIVLGTDWLLAPALRAGDLVRVLPGWQMIDEGAIHLLTPSGSAIASKTRAFSDWMVRALRRPPWQ